MTEFEEKCLYKANTLIQAGLSNLDLFELTDLLIKLETEKTEKNLLSDKNIDYNDEIVMIEECGTKETIDISVSGDNLFYCNGVLTKNSFGLPQTADLMFALISTEELESINQILFKQLKNRYGPLDPYRRFTVGIDRAKMRLYDVEQEAQQDIIQESDLISEKRDLKSKFKTFNFE
jgi:hypothetical protein